MADATVLAPLALLLWLPICLVAFLRFRPHVAAAIALLGSSLLLPEVYAFDLPGLPAIGKREIGCLAALLGTLFVSGRSLFPRTRGGWPLDVAMVVLVAGGVVTALTNGDAVRVGPYLSPGLDLWEGLSTAGGDVLLMVTPLLLGRALVRSPGALRDLFVVLGVAALAYSLLVLFEVRMSPKLHREIYGFVVQKALTTRRLGGYRPVVFMSHGLALATYVLTGWIAVFALWRARVRILGRRVPGVAVAYMGVVFLLCRSVTQYVYAVAVVPFVAFARPRAQLGLAVVIASVVLGYPAIRLSGAVSPEEVIGLAEDLQLPRIESLQARFVQEGPMLDRALERPLFGWGGYGRRRVYVEEDARMLVNDGFWIILLGRRGLLGYLSVFTMLLYPIFAALFRFSRLPRRERVLVTALALIVAVQSLDFLPNGFYYPHHMFLSGALMGAAQIRSRGPGAGRRARPASPRRAVAPGRA